MTVSTNSQITGVNGTSGGGTGPSSLTLLTAISAVGAGTAQSWGGGTGVFTVAATSYGDAVVSLQYQLATSAWVAAGADTDRTSDGSGQFSLPAGTQIRADVEYTNNSATNTAPVSITATAATV